MLSEIGLDDIVDCFSFRAVREGGLSEAECVRVSCPCRWLFWFQYDARVRVGLCVCLRVCECVF